MEEKKVRIPSQSNDHRGKKTGDTFILKGKEEKKRGNKTGLQLRP